jgi:Ca2+-binding RTX toxin-like protein
MTVDVTQPTSQDGLSFQELALYHEITAYRSEQGLAPLRLSAALTTTAGRHVADTRENIWAENVTLPEGADLHSWSDAYYYSDHRDPSVMWDAPARLGIDYPTAGYEISASGFTTTAEALAGWIGSPSHNAILTNTGVWEGIELQAIGLGVDVTPGAGIYEGRIFHVWFGESVDLTPPDISGTEGDDVAVGTLFEDRLFGLQGDDVINGDAGDDWIRGGSGDDTLRGELGDDDISGANGEDRISGGLGDDTLYGGNGQDRLWGGEGSDTILGGGGVDLIVGGAGKDKLTGGGSANTFVLATAEHSAPGSAGRDVITDFVSGSDTIELTLIDADADTAEDDAFGFIGTTEFSGVAGELRNSGSFVEGDVNGDGIADFQIVLLGSPELVATDFLL